MEYLKYEVEIIYGFRSTRKPETLVLCYLSRSPCYFFSSDELVLGKWKERVFLALPSFILCILKTHCMATAFVFMSSHNFQYCAQLCETKTSLQNTLSFHKCSQHHNTHAKKGTVWFHKHWASSKLICFLEVVSDCAVLQWIIISSQVNHRPS